MISFMFGLELCILMFLVMLAFATLSVASDNESGGKTSEAGLASFSKAAKEHVENIISNAQTYRIQMGGTLDGFNTVYYSETYAKFMREESKFEPNEYIIVVNTGDIDVVNPRIVINGRRDWFSADNILASILKPGMTDAEKAMAIYNFTASIEVQCHENDRRVGPPFPDDNSNPSRNTFKERANPVKAANHYYCSGCSLSAANFVILCRHAGLAARAVWMCPLGVYATHCVTEAWYDGGWHMFDPEVHTFYLEEDNETVASYEAIHKNPALALRTHDGGFASTGTKSYASFYEAHYPPHVMPVEQWLSTLSMTLRPGEKFIWRWDHLDKFRYGDNHRNRDYLPYRLANGKMIYNPDLAKPMSRNGVLSEINVKTIVEDGKLPCIHPDVAGSISSIIYKVRTAYPIVGGVVGGKFHRKTAEDMLNISVSIGESDWVQVWSADETGDLERYFSIDEIIDPKPNPARYEYYVKYEFRSGQKPTNAGINGIYIETDVQMSSASLPSLSVGANEVVYRDDTERSHSVQIIHGWKESSETHPPPPPANPISPSDSAKVEIGSLKKLIWEAAECPGGESIADYHIQVSPRSDMLHPISPSFDRIIFSQSPEWDFPQGWLVSGKTYFWRVRARNEWGAWSPWSQIWRFYAD
ncbi:transglutaminase domain-containing protein [Candidatus Poribacteria bacterium]